MLGKSAGTEPVKPKHLTRTFGRIRNAAGVTGVRLHDLRHFNATQLLANAVPPDIVAYRLGHASIKTTIDTYRSWIPGTDHGAADTIAAILADPAAG